MDPNYDSDASDDGGASVMAAAMGFSTFGKAPPPKKRKFNPATDAFISGDELADVDRGGKTGKGSGGNDVPLGKMRVLGVRSKVENEAEIQLEEEEEGEEDDDIVGGTGDRPRYLDMSLPPPIEDGAGPAYMDTSLPPPAGAVLPGAEERAAEESREMQARIDNILASIQPTPGDEQGESQNVQTASMGENIRQVGLVADSILQQQQRKAGPNDARNIRKGGGHGRGQMNKEWYLEYYDPGFNANPWENLEKNLGLGPVGSWIPYPEKGRGR